MNYRHAFHAGNFADVAKHVLLTLLIEHLKRKDKPFRVLDTHAGRGLYDLGGDEARRTGEAEEGIAQLVRAEAFHDPIFAAYREALAPELSAGTLRAYPGSPLIVRRLLRRQDRLSAYELHPVDADALSGLFAGDVQVKTIRLDGWLAVGAHLPPKEKRGLVLIDPPFEQPDEFDRIVQALVKAYRRWPTGLYAIWYPLKRVFDRDRFLQNLAASGIADVVAAEFLRELPDAEETLVGSGLVVVNPPYTFEADAVRALARLEPVLGRNSGATSRLLRIATERS